eukprot:evm.model.scf_2875.2 EVM.evm.TU.scf_2875.2   scf_2875:7946-12457(+)
MARQVLRWLASRYEKGGGLKGAGKGGCRVAREAAPTVSRSLGGVMPWRGIGSRAARGAARRLGMRCPGVDGPQFVCCQGWTGLLLFVPSAFAATLGFWQLDRRKWKTDLIERRKAQLQEDPVDIQAIDQPVEFQHVRAVGKLIQENSVFVGPRVRKTSGPDVQLGYVMVTPMSMSAWEQSSLSWRDRAILVCRGWVPESWKKKSRNPELAEEATALAAKTEGESVVEGVVMRSEVPSYFVPQNTPKQGSWFWIDVPEIAKSCGLPEETVMVQVLDKGSDTEAVELIDSATGGVIGAPMPDAYPVAKRLDEFVQFTVMPRDHLNYAFIWFTLSIATAIMGMRAIRQRALWRMRHGT